MRKTGRLVASVVLLSISIRPVDLESVSVASYGCNSKTVGFLFTARPVLPLRGGEEFADQNPERSKCSRRQLCMSSSIELPKQSFFTFEGLIGAGKSTLLAKLQDSGVAIIPEPLER